jgi:hypothetical protein
MKRLLCKAPTFAGLDAKARDSLRERSRKHEARQQEKNQTLAGG